ncbi:hypothetical protein B0H19DRAFT_1274774 [Mycena capillaripes]|nr:hypothetical protein B0H19DRAFT_1274774 [Mycena capillaripes]
MDQTRRQHSHRTLANSTNLKSLDLEMGFLRKTESKEAYSACELARNFLKAFNCVVVAVAEFMIFDYHGQNLKVLVTGHRFFTLRLVYSIAHSQNVAPDLAMGPMRVLRLCRIGGKVYSSAGNSTKAFKRAGFFNALQLEHLDGEAILLAVYIDTNRGGESLGEVWLKPQTRGAFENDGLVVAEFQARSHLWFTMAKAGGILAKLNIGDCDDSAGGVIAFVF